jgi:hypothetical protein
MCVSRLHSPHTRRLGGENLAVCQNNYAVRWFIGKELCLVFGIQLSFGRLVSCLPTYRQLNYCEWEQGSTINLYVMNPLYTYMAHTHTTWPGNVTLGTSLFIGGISTIVSFASAIVLLVMDRQRSASLTDKVTTKDEQPQVHAHNGYQRLVEDADEETIDVNRLPIRDNGIGACAYRAHGTEHVNMRDILHFPTTFWLLSVVCVCFYVAIFPFVSYGL